MPVQEHLRGAAVLGAETVGSRTFAFIKIGEFSHTNQHVLKQLQARFPELQATVIDLSELRVIRKRDVPGIMLSVASEFGPLACVSGARLRRHMYRTAYVFQRARDSLMSRLAGSRHLFTFQTQSLFDASLPGTPHFIYTDHTHLENFRYPAPDASTPLSHGWARLEGVAYQNARLVFTMSRNISRSLVRDYGCVPQKVKCVHAGSNVGPVAIDDIDNGRFSSKNILFVGVDWERKGGPTLLAAFRAVRQAHPDARLTIVGCSPPISEPGVHVEGRVPLGEVAKYYRAASVFCLPTLNEPFGLVFLEAFSYGLPVVATRLGAIPEIVADGKSGYLVAPRDPTELAQRLSALLGDPARCAKFGAHGNQWVSHRYTWEDTGHKIASYIKRDAARALLAQPEATRSYVGAPVQPAAV
jgi:glycosyltransferase involved in cell wall biosynthesis